MDEKDSQKPKGIEHKLKIKGNLQTTHTHTHTHTQKEKKRQRNNWKTSFKMVNTYICINNYFK